MNTSEREAELEAAVLGYLAEHPHAADTVEGIASWWLMRQRVRDEVRALARVLRRLVDGGVLEQIGTGEAARYRLAAGTAEPRLR